MKTHRPNQQVLRLILLIGLTVVLSCNNTDWEISSSIKNDEAQPAWLNQLNNDKQDYIYKQENVYLEDSPEGEYENKDLIKGSLNQLNDFSQTIASHQNFHPEPSKNDDPNPQHGFSVTIHNHNNKEEKKQTKSRPVEPLSRLELLYHNSKGLAQSKGIRQIAYEVLKEKIALNKTNPVNGDYLLAAGDEINIEITGPLELKKTVRLDDEGNIFLQKNIGKLNLLGQRFSKIERLIHQAISKEYQNFKLRVSLNKIHHIRVTITGAVNLPGLKSLPASSTLTQIIAEANGVHKDGSLREISIVRQNGKKQVIDLYRLLLEDTGKDPILVSGDFIHIPKITKSIAVLGPIKQGIYEIKNGETLESILKISGGLNAFTSQHRFALEKTSEGRQRILERHDLQKSKQLILADGMVIQFDEIMKELNNVVSLQGSVVKPGIYPFKKGMKISDLLKEGRGFLLSASLDKAYLQRSTGPTAIFNVTPGDKRGRQRFKGIWIDLKAILAGDKRQDLTLRRLDKLKILTLSSVQDHPEVKVLGPVRRPGRYSLTASMTLGDLVHLSGYFKAEIYLKSATIVRRRYSNEKKQFDVDLIEFSPQDVISGKKISRVLLQNHDQIVFRQVHTHTVEVQITGQVHFPGTYILPKGSKITKLLAIAGGILEDADLRAAEFSRQSIRELQAKRLNEMIAESEINFSRIRDQVTLNGRSHESMANHLSLLGLKRLKANYSEYQVKGRVVLDFLNAKFPTSEDNLVLENRDRIVIPKKRNTVLVLGKVFSPSAFVRRDTMTIRDYLNKAGGLKDFADDNKVYLVMSTGEVRSVAQIGFEKLLDMVPGPGDTILVPQKELGRSTFAQVSDSLLLVRQMAEIGLLGVAIKDSENAENNVNLGSSYDIQSSDKGYLEMIQHESKQKKE